MGARARNILDRSAEQPPCDGRRHLFFACDDRHTYVGCGSGWVPVGLAVFKTVAGRPSLSREGSTPSHSRHGLLLNRPDLGTSKDKASGAASMGESYG